MSDETEVLLAHSKESQVTGMQQSFIDPVNWYGSGDPLYLIKERVEH